MPNTKTTSSVLVREACPPQPLPLTAAKDLLSWTPPSLRKESAASMLSLANSILTPRRTEACRGPDPLSDHLCSVRAPAQGAPLNRHVRAPLCVSCCPWHRRGSRSRQYLCSGAPCSQFTRCSSHSPLPGELLGTVLSFLSSHGLGKKK